MPRTTEHEDQAIEPAHRAERPPTPPQWAEQHRERVYWYLRYLRCPHDLSEDLTQDALHRGCEHLGDRTADDRATDAWLRTTARNLFFAHQRRHRQRIEVQDSDLLERVWREEVEADSRRVALRACLDGLGGRARQALELHYVDGKGRTEIGRVLGISVHGVKSMLRRLRQSLKECTERRLR